jgi:hypothetical protein
MFRLIKLAMYAFVGYALYELYQGMVAQQRQGGGSFGRSFGGGGSQGQSFGNAGQNLTGAGEGQSESTLDADGGSTNYRVGRGVTA